jgi:asparagine synthase (glutamine-hydrolysing)
MIVVSNNEFENSKKFGKIYYKGDPTIESKKLLFFKGEVYPKNLSKEDLFKEVSKNPGYGKELKGEFFTIFSKGNNIQICGDRLGRESLFYYLKDGLFVASDDFWEIVKAIEPDERDFDAQSIKEFIVFLGGPILYKTIIKNLFFLPPSSFATFNLSSKKLNIEQYWDFEYAPQKITPDEAVKKIDSLFDRAMKQIKEKAGPEATYGLGLSGGLDSRLVAHYARKNGIIPKSFIIGQKRPRGTFLSIDHASSRKLSKMFKLNHKEIEYNTDDYKSKSFYDVRHYPMGSSQIFITTHKNLPNFNTVLTGMYGGEFWGGETEDIAKLKKEDLLEFFMKRWTTTGFSNTTFMEKVLSLVGVPKRKPILRKEIPGIVKKEEIEKMREQVKEYIDKNKDKSNAGIFQKFIYFNSIGRNKYGFFSSMNGLKKSYASIFFNPATLEYSLTWPEEFLKGRSLQSYFYLKKFPELSKVSAQSYEVPIYYKKKASVFRKLAKAMSYYLRGGTSLKYNKWATEDQDYRNFARGILLNKNDFFNKIFDLKKVFALTIIDGQKFENIVKVKQIMDIIREKKYKNF